MKKRSAQNPIISEDRARIIADFIYDWEMWLLSDGNPAYISASCERITGYTADEFMEKPALIYEIIHAEDRALYDIHTSTTSTHPDESILEFRIHHKDGYIVWLRHVCSPVFGKNGDFLGRRISNCDITAQKQAEMAHEAVEKKYRSMIERSPVIFYIVEPGRESPVRYISPQIEQILGFTQEEWISEPGLWEQLLHPEDRERVLSENDRSDQTGEPFNSEYRIFAKNGDTVWLHDESVRVYDEEGELLYVQGIETDITDRKKAEVERRESEDRYRDLVEHSQDLICTHDLEGRILSVNPTAVRLLGINTDEILKANLRDLLTPAALQEFGNYITNIKKHGSAHGFMHVQTWTGEERIWEYDNTLRTENVAQPTVRGTARDVTERKLAEKELKNAEEKLRNIVEHSSNLFYSHTPEHVLTYVSPQSRHFLGCEPEESTIHWTEFITDHPLNQSGINATQRAIDTGEVQPPYELELKTKDGRIIWVEVNEAPLVEDGRTTSIVGALRDITESKRIQNILQSNERRYRSIFDGVQDAIFVETLDGRILDANHAACEMYGYTRDEFLEKTIADLIPPGHPIWMPKDGGTSKLSEPPIETINIRSNGEEFPIEISGRFQSINGESVLLIVIRDISERKQVEKSLLTQTTALKAAANGIMITDAQGIVEWVNPAFTELTGYGAEEAIGQNPRLLRSGFQDESFYKSLWETILSGQVWRGEVVNRRKDGSLYTEDMTITPVRSADGEIAQFIAIKQDISERKRSEEKLAASEAKLRNLIAAMHDLVLVIDKDGIYREIAPTHQDLLYKPADELLGESLIDVFPPEQAKEFLGVIRDVLQTQQLKQIEYPLQMDGLSYWFSANITPMTEDAVVWVAHDITSRKQTEKTLLRQVQELMVLQEVSTICVQSTSEYELLSRVTPVIGDTFYPDHFGVLMVDNAKNVLRIHPSYQTGNAKTFPSSTPLTTGVSGHVVATGQSLNLGDVRTTGFYISVNERILSELCVPIKGDGKVLGVLNAESTQLDFFKREDERLLAIIGEQMGTAIEKLQLIESERARRQEAESLRGAASILTSSLNINEVLDALLTQLAAVIPYTSCTVFLFEKEHLFALAGRGFPDPQHVIGKEFPVSNPLFQQLLQKLSPIVIPNAQADPRFQGWGDADKIRGWMGIPIIMRDNLIGFLTIDHIEAGAYTIAHAELALAFARQAASALENARLFGEARKQVERLAALRKIDMTISSTVDLQVSLDVLLDLVVNLQNVDAANVLLVNPASNKLEYAAGKGFHTQVIEEQSLYLDEGLAGQAVQAGEPIFIADLVQDSARIVRRELVRREKFQSYAAVSLVAKEQVLGVLEVFHRNNLEQNVEWLGFLETLAGQASIAIDNTRAFEKLTESNLELIESYHATIEGWTSALEYRDGETEGHSRRVTEIAVHLAEKLGLQGEEMVNFKRGALLHDIGKIGVPDAILRKPGPLTDEEWVVMRQHPENSRNMLANIPFLKNALDIPLYHHEKWDGSGYPDRLKGEAIPLHARIFAFADVFDALTSDRPYRKAWSKEKASAYISEQAGIHFDPNIASIFLELNGL